ncbi:hypothetical protein JCM3775_003519 [Rhodotorula graminis]|uniref:Survival motor neuron Tudor domain-containing protein n=1 Tax=Rhodotorula graminis (strain WP1) TaxID=578459 RepID=A0A0P9IVA7_RHOGW|nr:uncharacterized protein RHOBADRAFT_54773 [Rhodotorula graminis WP1]KPV73567.1 hypothetical protein RHOBADRAFT_54773 [Rhodotorula graminis WP1]
MAPYTPRSPAAAAGESTVREATELAQVGADLVDDSYDHDAYYDDDGDDDPDLVFYSYDDDPQEPEPTSDLADLAYLDPLALVKAWECALDDLKEAHQERFLPPTQAPVALAQKQAKASFWYGPPPSEASTSKLSVVAPPPLEPAPAASIVAVSTEPSGHVEHIEYDAPPAKKRKRLTGSQKKARKVAKLGGGERASSRASSAVQVDAPEHDLEHAHAHERDVEPELEPQARGEPERESEEPRARPLIGPSQPSTTLPIASSLFPSFPPAPPIDARPPASARAGAAPFPVVPPVASLPSSFPPPPTIPPLTGTEPALEPETPEQLLEQALWSWFTAGYQTALLHAAAGVARFAPSGAQGQGGQQ